MRALLCLLVICLMLLGAGLNPSWGQTFTGKKLLQKTLAHHDPQKKWTTLKATFYYDEYRQDNSIRKSIVHFNNAQDRFKMERTQENLVITRGTAGDSCYVLVNGSSNFDADMAKDQQLDCDRSFLYRNYYLYMQGLPMKLKDPGTIVHPQVSKEQFMGIDYYKLKVTYREEVGSDVWYFFINRENFALEACQFYHDETAGDGEYIIFEGEVEVAGLKMPRERKWYTNKEGKYLGKDVITMINE